MRKFYCTRFYIEVLSKEPYHPKNLRQIAYDITDGDCSGSWGQEEQTELTPKETIEALREQGSDPEFFMLDDEGNDLEDQEVFPLS